MTSAEDDRSQRPAPGDGGEAGDWTTWLRSRLERVAAPERRQEEATGDQERADPDGPPGSEPATVPPAPRLPPSGQEPGPDLGLRLQWPSHPLEPQPRPAAREAPNQRPGAPPAAAAPAPAGVPAPAASSDPAAGAPARSPAARAEPPAPAPEVAPRRDDPAPVPPGARALSGLAEPLAPVPAHELVAGLDRLQSAVSSLSARVDGLADATVTFRSVMNERVDDYTETVMRAAKASASDVQEYRRMHAVSLGELRRNANDTAETLRRLTGWMEELARVQGDDERWATALSQAFDEAAAERREGEERALEAVSGLPERLQRIEQVLDDLAAEPDEPADPSLASAVTGVGQRLQRIEQVLDDLAAEPPDPLVPVVQSLAERLQRIEQVLDDLAAEPPEPIDPALAPEVPTLGERLERIESTVTQLGEELVDGPPSPPVLDAEQLGAIADAVVERLAARPPEGSSDPDARRTSRIPADPAPATPARSRRTTPIRAPSRVRSRTDR